MRVLHVLDHSIPLHSGYTFRTAALLREQRALGWQTFHLTSPKQGGSASDMEEVDGLLFYRTKAAPVKGIPLLRELSLMNKLRQRLEEIVTLVKPDLIHAHSPVLNVLPAIQVGRKFNIPVVYEIRAFWEDAAVDHGSTKEGSLRYRVTRGLETYAIRGATHVFTICEGLRKDILTRGIPSKKVTVIPNAVDIETFQLRHPPDIVLSGKWGLGGKMVIGFIGSFYAYEGLDTLISAMPKLIKSNPDARLLLVGGGPQDQNLKGMAQSLGLQNHVIFTGRVPHQEVSRYYDLVDVLVYPRHSMRLTELVTPLKPLEAMAQGHLLIASDVGGHRELIEHQKTGLLFKAGDVEALTSTLLELIRHPEWWPAMRANGRHFVENNRNWKSSVSRYRPVYESLAVSTVL